jgi:hypothetical protein
VRARSAIASNTGWTSVGDALMTCRISAVAVCCSSASWVSLKSRVLSIAITAWSANVCNRPISAGANGRTWLRSSAITPIDWPSRSIGTASTVRKPLRACSVRTSGYSVSINGTTSSTWTQRRSRNARPAIEVGRIGSTSPTDSAS